MLLAWLHRICRPSFSTSRCGLPAMYIARPPAQEMLFLRGRQLPLVMGSMGKDGFMYSEEQVHVLVRSLPSQSAQ